eukprot:2754034-Prymnesium_polylepis.1
MSATRRVAAPSATRGARTRTRLMRVRGRASLHACSRRLGSARFAAGVPGCALLADPLDFSERGVVAVSGVIDERDASCRGAVYHVRHADANDGGRNTRCDCGRVARVPRASQRTLHMRGARVVADGGNRARSTDLNGGARAMARREKRVRAPA